MKVKTPEAVTLLKLKTVSFTNAKGEKVDYREFSVLDQENEIIEGTCRKTLEMADLEMGDSATGIAYFDVVPNKDKDAKPKTFKVKLENFSEGYTESM